ncbi:hypothetical protein [Pseudoalteromonas spongiae]|uniref:hypothetical protein n=1 Tax=Pseudoalteromonas spongiae TaxID=298657 RepID=UPI00110B8141|nr:hypothetical protein [Pseudoalteromonas spongiae]TMO82044.1 hypothetical protein CWC15_20395 [Pseudoalteromonas spongiae]
MQSPLFSFTTAVSLLFLSGCNSTSDQIKDSNNIQTFQLNEGLEIQIEAPNGFKLTKEHYGFIQPDSFSRIKINEIETPYYNYLKKLTESNLSQDQLQLLKSEQILINGAKCTLLTLRTPISGTYFEKLWLISGDKLSSIKIEASYPESSNYKLKQAIRQSLHNISVQTNDNARIYSGLPFTLTETGHFKLVQRNLNSIVLTSEKFIGATVVISHGRLTDENKSTKMLGHYFLQQSKHLTDLEIYQDNALKIDGIPAISTSSYASLQGEPTWVYQITSSQKGKFLLVQSISKVDDKEEFFEDLKNLISHFKFK